MKEIKILNEYIDGLIDSKVYLELVKLNNSYTQKTNELSLIRKFYFLFPLLLFIFILNYEFKDILYNSLILNMEFFWIFNFFLASVSLFFSGLIPFVCLDIISDRKKIFSSIIKFDFIEIKTKPEEELLDIIKRKIKNYEKNIEIKNIVYQESFICTILKNINQLDYFNSKIFEEIYLDYTYNKKKEKSFLTEEHKHFIKNEEIITY